MQITDEDAEKFARAHDCEEASQRGEPDPWKSYDAEPEIEWRSERIAAVREGFAALSVTLPMQEPEPVEKLGRFGHHPDPAIDFETEVGDIEAELINIKAGFENGTPSLDVIRQRIARAMTFRAGGVETCVAAKHRLREIEVEAAALATPAASVAPAVSRLQLAIAFAMDRGAAGELVESDFLIAHENSHLGRAWHDAGIAVGLWDSLSGAPEARHLSELTGRVTTSDTVPEAEESTVSVLTPSTAPVAPAVKVKALKWRKSGGSLLSNGYGIIDYEINPFDVLFAGGEQKDRFWGDREAAKAAAQAHFEQRIGPALTSSTASGEDGWRDISSADAKA